MSSPNPNTALIFDALVRGLDAFLLQSDIALAQAEFSLGLPLAVRPLDVAWGFAPITPPNPADLCVSRGLVRAADILLADVGSQTVFTPSAVLGAAAVQGAYAFGSIFLTTATYEDQSGNPVTYAAAEASLACGPGQGAPPILMNRDFDLDMALSLPAPKAALPAGALEIARFVLDIDLYLAPSEPGNRITSHWVDLRRPRGWGGFAEELMAASLVPPLVLFSQNADTQGGAATQAMADAVAAWVGLKGWSPNFIAYWRSSAKPLPTRLHAFLQDQLGVTV